MEEKKLPDEYMMNENDEKFFASVQMCLRQDLPEPPAQVDSFIKAAARQQLKKKKEHQNKKFIFWSCGIAAAFALSFSFLFFSGTQEPAEENRNAFYKMTASSTADITSNKVAVTSETLPAQEPGWTDVMLEIADLSTEISEADMDVSFVAAYSAFYIGK